MSLTHRPWLRCVVKRPLVRLGESRNDRRWPQADMPRLTRPPTSLLPPAHQA